MDVLVQPAPPAQNHDDHLHARTACAPSELARGCEASGPIRPWVAERDEQDARSIFAGPSSETAPSQETDELLLAIVTPMGDGHASSSDPSDPHDDERRR